MSTVIKSLIKQFTEKPPAIKGGDKIKINTVISKAAFLYEKVRQAVEYTDEHLLRKNAILRIMKRKLMFEKVLLENYLLEKYHYENVAEQLVRELMRARYLDENVTMAMVQKVDQIFTKYHNLLTKIKEVEGKVDKKTVRYFLEMEAVEIEQLVKPAHKERALVRAMFSVMNPRIKIVDAEIEEKEKEMQLYIASHRALFKWDSGMLNYLLLTLYYPSWKDPDAKLYSKLASNFKKIQAEFEKQKTHPWGRQILKILTKKAIVYWVLQDIIEADPKKAEKIFADHDLLKSEVQKACQKRYKGVRVKLRRAVVRSIIYVFLTKMVLALAIEFPFDIYLAGAVNYNSATINILFPPILMFFVAIMIRMPKKENTQKIVDEIQVIAFNQGEVKNYELKEPKKRGLFSRFIFNLVYFITFVAVLMIIFWALNIYDFNVVSGIIFVLFLTLVSFFGVRIRRPVKDLLAVEKRDSIIGSIFDFVAMPFVSMGRWMSVKVSKVNFFIFIFDFIIEAPFKMLITIFEDMFSFYKEKKEDMMNE